MTYWVFMCVKNRDTNGTSFPDDAHLNSAQVLHQRSPKRITNQRLRLPALRLVPTRVILKMTWHLIPLITKHLGPALPLWESSPSYSKVSLRLTHQLLPRFRLMMKNTYQCSACVKSTILLLYSVCRVKNRDLTMHTYWHLDYSLN